MVPESRKSPKNKTRRAGIKSRGPAQAQVRADQFRIRARYAKNAAQQKATKPEVQSKAEKKQKRGKIPIGFGNEVSHKKAKMDAKNPHPTKTLSASED